MIRLLLARYFDPCSHGNHFTAATYAVECWPLFWLIWLEDDFTVGYAKFGLSYPFEHLGTKHFGKCCMAEQVLALFTAPTALLFVDGPRRHHQMHLRMIAESACVRVQNRDRARDPRSVRRFGNGNTCLRAAQHENRLRWFWVAYRLAPDV